MSVGERAAKLPATVRRLIALVGVPLFIALVAAAVCMPVLYLSDAQAEWRGDTGRVLSQAKQAPDLLATLERETALMRSSALWSKFYSSGSAMSSATAMHAGVSALLTGVQADAQSLTPIPAEELAFSTRIGVRFAASMRLNQLQSLMTGLANHAHYLRVETLIIAAPQMQRADENPPLAVTADIYGYELAQSALPDAGKDAAVALRAER